MNALLMFSRTHAWLFFLGGTREGGLMMRFVSLQTGNAPIEAQEPSGWVLNPDPSQSEVPRKCKCQNCT